MLNLFHNLRQRRMIQWIIAYLAFAWVSVQVAELLAQIFYLPDWLLQALVWILIFGFLALVVGGVVSRRERRAARFRP